MKKEIHPKYFKSAKVHCVCGNSFSVGSTKENIETESCSACHPFYTGKEKIIDTLGRVERFKKRMEKRQDPLKLKKAKIEKEKRAKEKKEKKSKK